MVIISFRNSQPFGVAVRYYLWQLDKPEQKIVTNIRWDNRDLAEVASLAARGEVNCLIVQDAEGSIDEATDTLGLPRLNHELAMFVWRDGAWERLKYGRFHHRLFSVAAGSAATPTVGEPLVPSPGRNSAPVRVARKQQATNKAVECLIDIHDRFLIEMTS